MLVVFSEQRQQMLDANVDQALKKMLSDLMRSGA